MNNESSSVEPRGLGSVSTYTASLPKLAGTTSRGGLPPIRGPVSLVPDARINGTQVSRFNDLASILLRVTQIFKKIFRRYIQYITNQRMAITIRL